ncbi:7-cyano-7-deazaguanine synthase QueC [Tumebacillus sp. ITR2]|uniref:7-cyano-7-deazaguanine synthase n=1 Tax=Tumebacillus amylolyticus TaxID=2801339 RepID=A0ABS1J8I7_9BACL|nr:7-cyano-7-deazaguanine synthase QueC [Tumebacillus amylolyticus]MBL0386592.1 7-cyano-7-deazaguanine synthase QueC [Tumebacillus amylolyticus]
MTTAKKAVIILSGGLDSTTCMAVAQNEGYELYPLSFFYGQKAAIELESAKKVSAFYGVGDRHFIADLNGIIRGSALTDADKEIPTNRDENAMEKEIPATYVPARNIIFLSIALSYAESIGATAMYIGVNALDYSGYPDCRHEFIEAFQDVINKGTAAGAHGEGIRIETPLQFLSKAGIVKLGAELGAPLQFSHSCYFGTDPSCGVCDSCLLRIKGFQEAGVKDPIPYAVEIEWNQQ